MDKKHRISARVPEEIATKLDKLTQLSGESLSEVIIKSIDAYYQTVARKTPKLKEALRRHKFIACADGDEMLASDYKQLATSSFSQKI